MKRLVYLNNLINIAKKTIMKNKKYYVYIITNKKRSTLYIGVTNNLKRRIYEHKNELVDGFSKRHHLHKLVFYETFNSINNAIQMEKKMKKWDREWKIELIEDLNPDWNDLYEQI